MSASGEMLAQDIEEERPDIRQLLKLGSPGEVDERFKEQSRV